MSWSLVLALAIEDEKNTATLERHRRFIWLDEPLAIACERMRVWIEALDEAQLIHLKWVFYGLEEQPFGLLSSQVLFIDAQSGSQVVTDQLGASVFAVVFNAWAGFHPDRFAVLSALVHSGGLVILLSPPSELWPSFQCPEVARMVSDAGLVRSKSVNDSAYLKWLVLNLRQAQAQGLIEKRLPFRLSTVKRLQTHVTQGDPGQSSLHQSLSNQSADKDVPLSHASSEQIRALAELLVGIGAQTGQIWWLQGERGRGKSQVVAWLVSLLVPEYDCQEKSICVVAPHDAAVSVLKTAMSQKHQSVVSLTSAAALLEKMATQTARLDLLIIEEAATLPFPTLLALLEFPGPIVMATTTVGYEGSGRLITERLANVLSAKHRFLNHLNLKKPIRWGQNDALEYCINRWLLLDARVDFVQADQQPMRKNGSKDFEIEWVVPHKLVFQPKLLSAVWALLYGAHYRTRPSDLRLLLDQPGVMLLIAKKGRSLLGACWLVSEGPFDESLAKQIVLAKRRPKGHILPQVLAQRLGFSKALYHQHFRCVRIAVHPQQRRFGVGRAMVAKAQATLANRGMSLGVSFALHPDTVRFWRACGFSLVRIGGHRHARTGELSLLALTALDQPMADWLDAQQILLAFQWQFAANLKKIADDCLTDWIVLKVRNIDTQSMAQILEQRLLAFGHGGAQLIDVLGLLELLYERMRQEYGSNAISNPIRPNLKPSELIHYREQVADWMARSNPQTKALLHQLASHCVEAVFK